MPNDQQPPADEVADALKATPRPHPTDPTIIEYERQGKVIAWNRIGAVQKSARNE